MAENAAALEQLLVPGVLQSAYQPLVDLASGAVVGYEALARGPEGSPLDSPDRMFAAARAAGLLDELDWACRAAAVDGALAAGLDRPGAPWLFVNVEPAAASSAAPHHLADLIQRAWGLRIVMEVTERALTARPAELLAVCARVRRYGWGVAVDDVGVDHALAVMPLLRPEVVKLDLGVVQGRPTPELAAVVHTVAAEVERTGAVLLAEGIESAAHADIARSMTAQLGQGWHLGRPGPLPRWDPAARTPLRLRPGWGPGTSGLEAVSSPFELAAARQPVQILPQRALAAMSVRLEQQATLLGTGVVVASAFQDVRHVTPAVAARYAALAGHGALVAVLGQGCAAAPVPGAAVRGGPLAPDDVLARQWVVAVIGPHFAGALIGREVDDGGHDAARRFESVLTYDRDLVLQVTRSLLRRVVEAPAAHRAPPVTEVPSPMPRPAAGDLSQDPALDTAAAAVAVCDATRPGFPLAWANRAFERLTGWSAEEYRGRDAAWLLGGGAEVGSDQGGAEVGSDAAVLHELLRDGGEGSVTVPVRRGDHEPWWDEWILAPLLDETGELARYAVIHTDVTDRVRAEATAQRWLAGGGGDPADLWRQLDGSAAALVLLHAEGEVAALNAAAAALVGREQRELVGTDLIAAVVAAPDRRAAWRAFHRFAEGAPDGRGTVETRIVTPSGTPRRLAWRALRLSSSRLLCSAEDVTARRAAEARIEQLRYHDETTGLANGARLRQQSAAAVTRAARQRSEVAVCSIGVGGLTAPGTGDTAVRDELLREVATRLRGPVRTSDLVAHCGDGRYAVLLDELGADADRVARRVAGDLRAALAVPFAVGDHRLFVEAAVATSVYPRDATDAERLVARAERAVEHALRDRPPRRVP